MENQTKIENLLPLYFEGKTTLQENERIEAWLNANEEHALPGDGHPQAGRKHKYGKSME